MNALIEIFRMNEVSVQTRIKLIKRLGNAINNEYAMNITEPLVYELVLALDPENEIKNDPGYAKATL
jgi:hypothetical protein